MKALTALALILVPFFASADPVPPSWDEERLAGFAEHKAEGKIHERERLKGKQADTEEREQWERDRKAALVEHRKVVKTLSPQEGGPEERADIAEKKKIKKEYEDIRAEYTKHKAFVMKRGKAQRSISEAQELGLDEMRPRYDLKSRVLYGAKPKFKPGTPSSGGGSSYSGGGGGGGGGSNFPPPPSFDDFPQGDGYVPPPPMDDMGGGMNADFPPPPPMPPMDDMGGAGGMGDFPPPPPPPGPPPDFGDFPPPPMPAEGF